MFNIYRRILNAMMSTYLVRTVHLFFRDWKSSISGVGSIQKGDGEGSKRYPGAYPLLKRLVFNDLIDRTSKPKIL